MSDWQVTWNEGESADDIRCELRADFEEGVTLAVHVWNILGTYIGLNVPRWKNPAHVPREVTLEIPGRYRLIGPAGENTAFDGIVVLKGNTFFGLVDAMAHSDVLTVSSESLVRHLDVRDAGNRYRDLVECARLAAMGGPSALGDSLVPDGLAPGGWVSNLLEAAGVSDPVIFNLAVFDWTESDAPVFRMFWEGVSGQRLFGSGGYVPAQYTFEPVSAEEASERIGCEAGFKSVVDRDTQVRGIRVVQSRSICQSADLPGYSGLLKVELTGDRQSVQFVLPATGNTVSTAERLYDELARLGPDYMPR